MDPGMYGVELTRSRGYFSLGKKDKETGLP